jgi:hypothetical protein
MNLAAANAIPEIATAVPITISAACPPSLQGHLWLHSSIYGQINLERGYAFQGLLVN